MTVPEFTGRDLLELGLVIALVILGVVGLLVAIVRTLAKAPRPRTPQLHDALAPLGGNLEVTRGFWGLKARGVYQELVYECEYRVAKSGGVARREYEQTESRFVLTVRTHRPVRGWFRATRYGSLAHVVDVGAALSSLVAMLRGARRIETADPWIAKHLVIAGRPAATLGVVLSRSADGLGALRTLFDFGAGRVECHRSSVKAVWVPPPFGGLTSLQPVFVEAALSQLATLGSVLGDVGTAPRGRADFTARNPTVRALVIATRLRSEVSSLEGIGVSADEIDAHVRQVLSETGPHDPTVLDAMRKVLKAGEARRWL